MKVIVDRTPLHKALQACSVVTDRSNSAPILQGVRISTAGKGALWVVATDLNLTLRLSVAATVHGGGERYGKGAVMVTCPNCGFSC